MLFKPWVVCPWLFYAVKCMVLKAVGNESAAFDVMGKEFIKNNY
jgi:hypothetical protein